MKRHSVKTKISIAVLIVSILSSVIVGIFSLVVYKNMLEKYIGEKAMSISLAVSANVDGDAIKIYDETGEKDAYYDSIKKFLADVKKNTGLTYLYIMTDNGSNYKYIAEGVLETDNQDEVLDLGDTDSKDSYGSEPQDALTKSNGTYSAIYENGKWGKLISGFAPIYDSNNKAVAVIGLDISAEAVSQNLNSFIPILVIVMLFTCFFIYIIINEIVKRVIIKPIVYISDIADQISTGDYSIEIDESYCKNKDEIGILAKSFKKISM